MRVLSLFPVVSLLAVAQTSFAADLPLKTPTPPPTQVIDWTGLYIGGHAGYGWGQKEWIAEPRGIFNGFDIKGDIDGGLGGVQVGLNYQIDRYVFGVEGQWSWSHLVGTHVGSRLGFTNTLRAETEWLATITGRVGYAFDRWLLYVDGGVAWAHDRYFANLGAFPALQFEADETRIGWTIGGGVEYAVGGNWSMRVGYSYMNLDSHHDGAGGRTRFSGLQVMPAPPPPPPPPPILDFFDSDINQQVHTIKFGISYRFSPTPGLVSAKY